MSEIYCAAYVSLHVRKSNKAAIALYRDSLGFSVHAVDKGYCKQVVLIGILECYNDPYFAYVGQTLTGKMPTICGFR
jgi:ribosomal protein S18 acetylase RimI-like enzyme